MRNLTFVVAAVAALVWSGVAMAVVGDTTVVATDGGKSLDGATVSLTFKDAGGKKISTVTHKTTATGKRTFRIPSKTAKVDITVTAPNGQREARTDIDVSTLTGHEIDIDVPGGSVPPSGPGRGAGGPYFRPMPSGPFTMPGGPYLAFEGLCNFGKLGITERPIDSDIITFESNESGRDCGGGVTLGFGNWMMPASPFPLSPFVSADFLSQDIAHNFVGGSSIGETIKFIGTLGLQADFYSAPTAQVYLLGGLALVEKEFTINFIGAGQATSDQWLWGGTLGAGFAFSPQALQFDNRQVTVFVQFQHIWVEDANWSSPAPSPAFTYQFSNGMDIFKFGARVPIGMH